MRSSIEKVEGRAVDGSWDFKGANTKYSTHGFHGYPAMMIPQIARRLIEENGEDSKVLLDPFMGSGTALVEAKLHPQFERAYGIDVNPLALLIARVKTTPLDYELLRQTFNEIMQLSRDGIQELRFELKEVEKPCFFNIDYWFKPHVIDEISIIKGSIDSTLEGRKRELRDFFYVVLSDTIRRCSNARNGEYKLYRLDGKRLSSHYPSPIKEFEAKSVYNMDRMRQFEESSYGCEVRILNEDSRAKTSIEDESVDILLTSPPYGDSQTTVSYGQFSRLSLQWMGYEKDKANIDKISLGGQRVPDRDLLESPTLKRVFEEIARKDQKRADKVLDFYLDFYRCVEEFDRVMRAGSKLCFVVGNRTVKSLNIPTDTIVVELFKQRDEGYRHIKTIGRNIPSKRLPRKSSPTNVKGSVVNTMSQEHIVILEKH